jgi:A/G-specific adenine glycosylase
VPEPPGVPLLRERPLGMGAGSGVGLLEPFVRLVLESGHAHYRELPWRTTRDPYAVLVSEVMLQQTQAARVAPKYAEWLERFPSLEVLAGAPLEPVLELWRGLGYNRRALALKRAAECACELHGGRLPETEAGLRSLPGVGPSTAAGVLVFAHDTPAIYLETNVRTVFLHDLFDRGEDVPDADVRPLVHAALEAAMGEGVGPREWYTSLLDRGAHLKRTVPNPSRRSAHYRRQSAFEGSRRQKRAWLLRAVMADPGHSADEYARQLAGFEQAAGREEPAAELAEELLGVLANEGLLACADEGWLVG